MPRFADNWVLDRVMFDYVQGGSCACCGLPHLFAPGGIEGMINAMSDLETDAATNEINAAKASPWPDDMRDQIWSDRLLLRYRMKKEMKVYRAFLEGVVKECGDGDSEEEVDIKDAVPILQRFCTDELSPKQLREIFQLPRSELAEDLKNKYKICSAYAVVFCSVVEQVANFPKTGYGVDARCIPGEDGSEEIFEKELKYEKVGPGFTMGITTKLGGGGAGDWEVNGDVLQKFLLRTVGLAGPILLGRAAKTLHHDEGSDSDGDKDGSEAGGEGPSEENGSTPSFRSDRRVVRLLIARYWADRLMKKYNDVQNKKKEDKQ